MDKAKAMDLWEKMDAQRQIYTEPKDGFLGF